MDFGMLIKEGSVEAVKAACREFAAMTDHEVEVRARKS